jgi:hypothetical protein|tara:strand:+ start:1375 stop:1620 length:246 start_codon:yes stop_codon:yes gene_type:complete
MIDQEQRGRAAAELLRNETLVEAMDEIAGEAFAQFLSTNVESYEVREGIWATGQALSCLKRKLDSYVGDGKMKTLGMEKNK